MLKMQEVDLSVCYPRIAAQIEKEKKRIEKQNELYPFAPALEYCRTLPSKTKKEKKIKKQVMDCYPNCCFNHRIGMPTITYEDPEKQIQWESDPIEFSAYEEEMVNEYESTHFFAENKCRGAGASERLTIRHMLYKYAVENRTLERKCLICGSISITISKNFTHRIKLLADKVPFLYKEKPNSDFPRELFFAQGGQIIAIPAEEDAFRSYDKVGDEILEEVSSWDKENDEPVLKAAEPHVFKSNARIGNLTTPKGKKGYYWDKIFTDDPDVKTKYKKHYTNWRRVVGIPEPNVVFEETEVQLKEDSCAEMWIGKKQKEIEKYYRKQYKNDSKYRRWFDKFFYGITIDQFFDFAEAIISLKEIIRLYREDRGTYDQEADNKFIITGDIALGSDFEIVDESPTNFESILGIEQKQEIEELEELEF